MRKGIRIAVMAFIMSVVLAVTACGTSVDYKNISTALDAYSTGSYIVGKTVTVSTDKDEETCASLESLKLLYKGDYLKDGEEYPVYVWIENDYDWVNNRSYTVRITDIELNTGMYYMYGIIQK